MSEYQPERTMKMDEKVFQNFDGNPRYSEFDKAVNAESVEDPMSSIHIDSASVRKKQILPSLPPPPIPRSAKARQEKEKEVSHQHSSENSLSKKRPKGGNFEEKKIDLIQQDSEQVNEIIIPNVECNAAVSSPTNINTKDTSSLEKNPNSINILPRPYISDDFQRISQMPDAVKEAYMRETYTNCKLDKPFGTIKEETEVKDNSYVPMTFVKKETKSTSIIDRAVKESDENPYMEMRYVGTKTATVNVISPATIRKANTKQLKSLSKRQLVRRLEESGLKDLAAVCEKEKLDGQFLEKHVSDEDLMQDPFLLTRFQIKKLRAIIDGWRPISDFPNDVDSASD